jgi:predicted nucleotidyltransferase
MTRADALARLKPLEPALRREGLSALYLFGSVGRDDATETSDVDLLFDVAGDAGFSLFDQVRIQLELADALHVGVDLIPVEGLRPAMRARIVPEMVRVF